MHSHSSKPSPDERKRLRGAYMRAHAKRALVPADPVVVRLFKELRYLKRIGDNQEPEWKKLVHYLATFERLDAR
jgi:hypothetical protein